MGQVSITCRICGATSISRIQNIHENILHDNDITRTNCNDSRRLEVVHSDVPVTSTEVPSDYTNITLRVWI